MTSPKREAQLVLRAQTGDLKALDTLLEGVQATLYRYLRGVIGDEARAEDVLQDVFVIICRKLKWLRDPLLFRPWAYRIASREAMRCLRRERRWRDQIRDEGILAEIPDAIPEPQYSAEQLAALVEAAPPASRAVLLLHYQEELSLQAVADVLDLPLGTVKSRLAYGLSVLRSGLKTLC